MQSEASGGVQPHIGLSRIKPHMVVTASADNTNIHIDISSNESVYGPSQSVLQAARAATQHMHRYASAALRDLSTLIATHHGIDPEGVACGHGSDDLLLRIAGAFLQPGDELVCSINGYQRIPNFAHTANAFPVRVPDRNFTVQVDSLLSGVTDRTRVVMLANPDNPTGTYVPGNEIRRLRENLPQHILLVLDSAYLEYASQPDFEDPTRLIEEYGNVVMTRTFSKIHGLAGIRLGWAYAAPALADAIRKIGMTFPLSNVAYAAGKAALADESHPRFVFEHNEQVRTEFTAGLSRLGFEIVPSQTNFLLARVRHPGCSAEDVYDHLRSKGILPRRLAAAAFSDYIRFTLGFREQMNEVLEVLERYLDTK